MKTLINVIFGAVWWTIGYTMGVYNRPPCPPPKVVMSETPMCYNSGITTAAIKLTYGECKEICKVRERMDAAKKK